MRQFTVIMFCAGCFAAQASAGTVTYVSTMLGSQETPPNASTATGSASVTLDTILQTLFVSVNYTGLIGGSSAAAHIHCCAMPGVAAGVAVPFVAFPSATSGSYLHTFDLTSAATYSGGFLTSSGGTAALAEGALISGLNAGLTYTNIHDGAFPGGEIRGQLSSTVPEPATLALGGAGLLLFALARARRRY